MMGKVTPSITMTNDAQSSMSCAEEQNSALLPAGSRSGKLTPSSSAELPGHATASLNKPFVIAASAKLDTFFSHLHRCFQSPADIETVLIFLWSSTQLTSSILDGLDRRAIARHSSTQHPPLTGGMLARLIRLQMIMIPKNGMAPALLSLSQRLRTFSTLTWDTMMFLRLWGLLDMYSWAQRLFLRFQATRGTAATSRAGAGRSSLEQEKSFGGQKVDSAETVIEVCQILSCSAFQALENAAYLAQTNVLVWKPAKIEKVHRRSAQFWGAFVGLELAKLLLEKYKRGRQDLQISFQEKKRVENQEWTREWRRLVATNLAWLLLMFHWGSKKGLLNDLTLSAIATIPGFVRFRDLWRRVAQ
ncbi:hypothetical protein BX600DRAFT_473252 [Xylariales sp. PMI_506]|nr:hypothetical protein BX600DRAFT_473252 [Xylariales sp. PMI_506]